MKQITCAICIRFGDTILLAHSTGMPWDQWNFPKGIADDGEDHLTAVVRELVEETSLVVDPTKLVDLGIFDYLPEKDMHLYLYDAPSNIDVKTLKCESMFFCDKKQMQRPEVDGFRMVPFSKLPVYLAPRIKEVYYEKLKSIIEGTT